MILPLPTKAYLARDPVDMRWSFDRLADIVRTTLAADPLSGHLFVFRNRGNSRLKILVWDRNGFWLFYKRLEKGRFAFLDSPNSNIPIDFADLLLGLEGISPIRLKRNPILYSK